MRQGDFRRSSRRFDGFAPGRSLVVVAVVQGPGNPPVSQPKAVLSGCPSALVQRSRSEAGGSSSANPGLPAPLPSVASPNLASVPVLALIAGAGAVGKGSGRWAMARGCRWPGVMNGRLAFAPLLLSKCRDRTRVGRRERSERSRQPGVRRRGILFLLQTGYIAQILY